MRIKPAPAAGVVADGAGPCARQQDARTAQALADLPLPCQSTFTVRSRRAFAITLTDDSAIAAAATMGDNSSPKKG